MEKHTKVAIYSTSAGLFNIEVEGGASFINVPASLAGPTQLSCTIEEERLSTTIVTQPPPADVPASSNSPASAERLHIFDARDGSKTTLVIPPPKWLVSLGGEVLDAAKKGIRAPMPSVVVDVRVQVGDVVKKGQAVVILESMKTESVLRSEKEGKVVSVSCKKGEMVGEGKELVEIEDLE